MTKRVVHTKAALIASLNAIGIGLGDKVYVRADFSQIGRTEGRPGHAVVEALLDAIGPEGTIIGVAFSKLYFLPFLKKGCVFTEKTSSIAGGLASLLLANPLAVRSKHPGNSFVAIGKDARTLLEGHNADTPCFSLVKKMMDLDVKMLLLGCEKVSPGFSTVHLVQEQMRLSYKNIFCGWSGIYYKENGHLKRYVKKDIPGCSMGFGKFYPLYEAAGVLKKGVFGNANATLISARDAYPIDYATLSKNPLFPLCDDPSCLHCRGSLLYNKKDMFSFYRRYAFPTLLHLIKKVVKK